MRQRYETIPDPLEVAERGIAVFPIPEGGKVPALRNWPNRCIRDAQLIRRHWPTGANVGVGCKASGLLVVDLDRHHDDSNGVETFSRLCHEHGQAWPATLTVVTPRRGLHLYFWAPRERSLGNSSGRLGPGIDTRGPGDGTTDGGYVVGPTSIWGGRTYDIVRDLPIIDLPQWIADLLDKPKWTGEVKPIRTLPRVRSRYANAALQGEVQNILNAHKGSRNDQLNRSAFVLGTLVGSGALDEADTVAALRAAADAVGLVADDGERQVDATIRSGLNAGIRRPRYLRGA